MSANLISAFSGDEKENENFWIAQLKEIANLEKWSQEKSIIILKLHCRHNALKFLKEDPIAQSEKDFQFINYKI